MKTEWKNININKQNVENETGRSTLIKMPHSSDYDGFKFWHPSKLVRQGRNSNSISIGYTDEFIFQLKKYGKGKYNKFDIVDEIEIDAEDFEQAFGVMNDNIREKKKINYYETHKPKQLEAEAIEADDSLKDE